MMTETVGIAVLKRFFDDHGFTVSYGPTEKLAEGEISLRLDDFDIIIEDSYLYHLWYVIAIGFQLRDPSLIPPKVSEVIKLVEEHLYSETILDRGTFKFVGASVKQSGEMYQIKITCMYKELVTIDQ
jgi:hypothetical protein